MKSCQESLTDLTESTWPGVVAEDPVPLGSGATQVSWKLGLKSNWTKIDIQLHLKRTKIMLNPVGTNNSKQHNLTSSEAVFDVNALKDALFPGGTADPSASYVCSQSIFKCDLLFNADPSATISGFQGFNMAKNYMIELSRHCNCNYKQKSNVPRSLWDKPASISWGSATTALHAGFMTECALRSRLTGTCPVKRRKQNLSARLRMWWLLCCHSTSI